MWCELQNPISMGPFHCEEHSNQNPIHHLHHHQIHHDFPHFSQTHEHCFIDPGCEDHSAFHIYGNEQEYNGQICSENCHNGWQTIASDNENYFDKSPCCPALPNSASPNLPTEAQLEKAKIFKEISQECEHLLSQGECDRCTIRDEKGEEQSIPISDLVEIVLKTAQSIKDEPGDTVVLSKKRQQNKMAAAKYRDRQKAKWEQMQNEREVLEKRNKDLKTTVLQLQKEVAEMREKILNRK